MEERDIGDELDISGIEDVEIEFYLMSPSEIKNKTALWMKVNKEYLKAETEGQTREAWLGGDDQERVG